MLFSFEQVRAKLSIIFVFFDRRHRSRFGKKVAQPQSFGRGVNRYPKILAVNGSQKSTFLARLWAALGKLPANIMKKDQVQSKALQRICLDKNEHLIQSHRTFFPSHINTTLLLNSLNFFHQLNLSTKCWFKEKKCCLIQWLFTKKSEGSQIVSQETNMLGGVNQKCAQRAQI